MLNPVVIETKRLTLKGFLPQDLTCLFENYPKDEIKEILGHRTEDEYQKEELKQKNGYASYNRSFVLFLLRAKGSDEVIGRCGLHNWNMEHKRAEIGYYMSDENFKRKGLMTEAAVAVIAYGFDVLKLHRIEALVGSQNYASLKILQGQNFIKEGVLRQHLNVSNKREDSILFSKLCDEYVEEVNSGTTYGS